MPAAVADHKHEIPPESVTGPAGEVYQKQIAHERAEMRYESIKDAKRDEWQAAQMEAAGRGGFGPMGGSLGYLDHPEVIAARKEADRLLAIAHSAQAEVGGVVMCIEATYNLPKAQKRIASLSTRAVKLGLDPITLKVTDERVILNYTYREELDRSWSSNFEHVYCILSGGTPKVEGFQFLATIEHTPAGNLVKKVPILAAQVRGLIESGPEDRAREALEAIDVSHYRTTEPICEHCNKIRSRKDTYLVYNNKTGEIKQVGRSCLRDYTGADNPEAIVKFLEMYFDMMRFANTERGREVIYTRDWLAHVAAAGLVGGEYQKGYTRDWAFANYNNMRDNKRVNGKPDYIEPDESHYARADQMIEWALKVWDADNDYALNVKTAIANEIVPEKGYGLVASVFAAKQRWDGDQERAQIEASMERGHIGVVGERSDFIATVIRITERHSDYTPSAKTIRMEDERGNRIVWFASNLPRIKGESKAPFAREGVTYKVRATIKNHDDHERYGKSTIITRAAFLHSIDEPDYNPEDAFEGPIFNQRSR